MLQLPVSARGEVAMRVMEGEQRTRCAGKGVSVNNGVRLRGKPRIVQGWDLTSARVLVDGHVASSNCGLGSRV